MEYIYTVPKVMVLGSFFPKSFTSLYVGAGGSFGGVKLDENEFHGLFANVCVGADLFNLTEKVKGTFQLGVDVPVIAASQQGERPYPLAEIRIGLGF